MGTSRQPIQSREEINYAVQELTRHFQVKFPEIRCTNGTNSRANGRKMTIGLRDWHATADKELGKPFDLTYAVLHEFGHVVDWQRRTINHRDPHGLSFINLLEEIVVAWYGPDGRTVYPWHYDYYKVYTHAYRRGWTTRRWFNHERRLARRPVSPPVPMPMTATERAQLETPIWKRAVPGVFTGMRVEVVGWGKGWIEWQRGTKMRVRVKLDDGRLIKTPVSSLRLP